MKTNTLITEEKEFVFEFSFSKTEPLNPNVSPPVDNDEPLRGTGKYVECFIYRCDQPYLPERYTETAPEKYFYWRGMLNTDPVYFELIYDDNINIKGDMKLFTNVQTDLSYVWIDCDFGLNLTHRFMGDMARIVSDEE